MKYSSAYLSVLHFFSQSATWSSFIPIFRSAVESTNSKIFTLSTCYKSCTSRCYAFLETYMTRAWTANRRGKRHEKREPADFGSQCNTRRCTNLVMSLVTMWLSAWTVTTQTSASASRWHTNRLRWGRLFGVSISPAVSERVNSGEAHQWVVGEELWNYQINQMIWSQFVHVTGVEPRVNWLTPSFATSSVNSSSYVGIRCPATSFEISRNWFGASSSQTTIVWS